MPEDWMKPARAKTGNTDSNAKTLWKSLVN
jgi:hypothetical protein